MRLPPSVHEPLDTLLDEQGLGRIRMVEPVGGGCITETGRLRTSDQRDFFLKWSAGEAPAGLFRAEADSLEVMAATGAVRVPGVVHVRDVETGTDPPESGAAESSTRPDASNSVTWLLLEWLPPGSLAAHSWPLLGQSLAALHREQRPGAGWPSDNFIGSLPQANESARDWPDFWRSRRLLPQLERATASGCLDAAERARFDPLLNRLDSLLAPAATDGCSLLHGDLWSGNTHILRSGDPALIDPSCSFGHREVDLAMTRLFGGFDPVFYAAYEEIWPLSPGAEARRRVYQLYYLLVHVNMFGAGYRARTLATLESIGQD